MKKIKVFILIMITIIATLYSIKIEAKSVCEHEGCFSYAMEGSKYCNNHTCMGGQNGCFNEARKYHSYCTSCFNNLGKNPKPAKKSVVIVKEGECAREGCFSKSMKGSKYCSNHTCMGGENGCYNKASKYHTYCSSCLKKVRGE